MISYLPAALDAEESTSVTAGLGGFLTLFFMALATWWLVRNMNQRLRRMRYRHEEELAQEAERAAVEKAKAAALATPAGDSSENSENLEIMASETNTAIAETGKKNPGDAPAGEPSAEGPA